jgi:hypothetical protein
VKRKKTAEGAPAKAAFVPPRASRLLWGSTLIPGVFVCALIWALFNSRVPLGETNHFVFRWSRLYAVRIQRDAPLLVILPLVGAALKLVGSSPPHRRLGVLLAAITMLGLVAWTWWLPPAPLSYHYLNLTSPSQDGAFVLEAEGRPSVLAYLRGYQSRLNESEQALRGTRVLSNPPGTAALAIVTRDLISHLPGGWWEYLRRTMPDEADVSRTQRLSLVMCFGTVLCAAWFGSSIFAYILGRRFLSITGALLFSLLVTFNPQTVAFSPGKDSMQLLTINAMLWAWFGASGRRGSVVLSALAGAILVIGSLFSLVHLWIAVIALAASLWQAHHDRQLRRVATHRILPAIAGATALVIAGFAIGWNIPATLLSVTHRYNQVQASLGYSRSFWFVIGLPLFLLFLGPGVWTFAVLRVRKRYPFGFGLRLLICTIVVMLLTYLLGITYELPRLWIAFLPPLILGLMIDRPLLQGRSAHRVFHWMYLFAAVQILVTAFHVDLLDPREAEYRLLKSHPYSRLAEPEGKGDREGSVSTLNICEFYSEV